MQVSNSLTARAMDEDSLAGKRGADNGNKAQHTSTGKHLAQAWRTVSYANRHTNTLEG